MTHNRVQRPPQLALPTWIALRRIVVANASLVLLRMARYANLVRIALKDLNVNSKHAVQKSATVMEPANAAATGTAVHFVNRVPGLMVYIVELCVVDMALAWRCMWVKESTDHTVI